MNQTPIQVFAPLNDEFIPRLQTVEITSRFQIPAFHIVGLADREVSESRERVRAAIEALGIDFPQRKILVNLSPAGVRKNGTGLDLAIALAVLGERARIDGSAMPFQGKVAASGELSLGGEVRPAGRTLRAIYAAWNGHCERLYLSIHERREAEQAISLLSTQPTRPGLPPFPDICFLEHLSDLFSENKKILSNPRPETEDASAAPPAPASSLRFSPALGKLLGLAAAGHHHLLLLGPRGAGKSTAVEGLIQLCQATSSPSFENIERALIRELSPSSSASSRAGPHVRPAALLGTVQSGDLRPGLLALAHAGCLVADEFPEWHRDSIECLRDPLERRKVLLSRAVLSSELPARFVFAATGNLCPCGGVSGSSTQGLPDAIRCRCGPVERNRYLAKISGPIVDRFDLVHLLSPRVALREARTVTISDLAEKAARAHERLRRRWGTPSGSIDGGTLDRILSENPKWEDLLGLEKLSSLRSRHKKVRVALTLAAWSDADILTPGIALETDLYRLETIHQFH